MAFRLFSSAGAGTSLRQRHVIDRCCCDTASKAIAGRMKNCRPQIANPFHSLNADDPDYVLNTPAGPVDWTSRFKRTEVNFAALTSKCLRKFIPSCHHVASINTRTDSALARDTTSTVDRKQNKGRIFHHCQYWSKTAATCLHAVRLTRQCPPGNAYSHH